jgi:hypothetical protein
LVAVPQDETKHVRLNGRENIERRRAIENNVASTAISTTNKKNCDAP